jgi:hypothetical protein
MVDLRLANSDSLQLPATSLGNVMMGPMSNLDLSLKFHLPLVDLFALAVCAR